MIEKRCADALSARDSAGVHPFELSVISGEFSDRAHGQQLAVRAQAEERDGRIDKAGDIQGVSIFGRSF